MKKAAIYLRVSTDIQDYGRQEVELSHLAQGLGYTVVRVYEEKQSAVLDMETRDQLTEMRKLTKEDVERIFIWDITRLSRKATDFISLVNEFADKGICIHFKDKNIVTLDDDGKISPMATIYLYMLGVFAQMDAENLKAKFKSGKENALRKGHSYTNIAPFGYFLKDKHLYVKEDEAEFVRLAFNLYSEGKDLQYIADIFNARKVPLKSGKSDIVWVKGTIYQLLKNTVYHGKGKYVNILNKDTKEKRERHFDAPHIIDKGLFDIVQERFNLNRSRSDKGRSVISLVRGLLFCGLCGKAYIFANNNKKRVYRDSDVRANVNQRLGCQNGQLNFEKCDKAVWLSIRHIYHYDQYQKKSEEDKLLSKQQIETNKQTISDLNAKIKELEVQQKRLNSAFLNGSFSEEELQENKTRILDEKNRYNQLIDELFAKNANLQRRIEPVYNLSSINVENLTLEEKKDICKEYIESIHVYSEGMLVRLLRVLFKNGFEQFIGYHSKKDYIIVFTETISLKFDSELRKGIVYSTPFDPEKPFCIPPSEQREVSISDMIDFMDCEVNRISLI